MGSKSILLLVIVTLLLYYFFKNKNKKIFYYISYIISALPVLAYPGVIVANIMALPVFFETPKSIQHIIMIFIVITSTIYPIIYIYCLLNTIVMCKKNEDATKVTLVPLFVILMIAGLIFCSALFEINNL